MTIKKWMLEYHSDILRISLDKNHTEATYYEAVKKLFRSMFPSPKYRVESNISDDEKNPDVTIYQEIDGTGKMQKIIKIEVKDFVKWDKKIRDWKPLEIHSWIRNPDKNNNSRRLRKQIYDYSEDGCIVIITDLVNYWVVDPEAKITDPETDSYSPAKILRKYRVLLWNKKNPASLKIQPNISVALEHLKTLLLLHIDLEIKTPENLRRLLMDFVKPNPYSTNLFNEIQRILDKPRKGKEQFFKKHLESLQTDFNNTLFRDTPSHDRFQFVDLYTQLILFGTFMGWNKYHSAGDFSHKFSLKHIIDHLPYNSVLPELIKVNKMPKRLIKEILMPIERIFNHTNYNEIMTQIDHIYGLFYSDFLHEYNKDIASNLGIVNTPDEIISFIIRGTDFFLRNRQWKVNSEIKTIEKGILNKDICFLDPASGTMGFTVELLKYAYQKIRDEITNSSKYSGLTENQYNQKTQENFNNWVFEKAPPPPYLREKEVNDYLDSQPLFLENCFAFEVLMSPYVLGYMRILIEAEELGIDIDLDIHKPQLYLNNTLMNPPEEIPLTDQGKIDWNKLGRNLPSYLNIENPSIKNEIITSLRIRHDSDIMVIWGNPPYNIGSQNETKWITDLIVDYKDQKLLQREQGKPARKRIVGLNAMNDDAIKFHRFAQWKICENNNQGMVSFVSNGFFIQSDTARAMRKILRRVYDEIWVIHLYGNFEEGIPDRLKKQGIPKDENVFGSACGRTIAITFMLRYPPEKHKENECKVMYSELAGLRDEKLEWLSTNDIESIEWEEVGEQLDHEFTPQDESTLWNSLPSINGIFIYSNVGIITKHDNLVSNVDKERLIEIISDFYDGNHEYEIRTGRKGKKIRFYKKGDIKYQADGRDWEAEYGLQGKKETAIEKIIQWQYRGFDKRHFCYYKPMIARGAHAYPVMQFLLPEQHNIAINLDRGIQNIGESNISLVSRCVIEHKATSDSQGKGTYIFPNKVNFQASKADSFKIVRPAVNSNIDPRFLNQLPYDILDEDIFYYIYSILYTPKYKTFFKSSLIKEYPRIPFPKERTLILEMSNFGRRLAKLHLMLANEEKKKFKEGSSLYNLLNNHISDELRIIDCRINEEANTNGERRVKRIIFEGESKPVKDENEELIEYRVFFDIPKESKGNNTFWIGSITHPIWNFQIGGKGQIREWLKNRKYSPDHKKNHMTRGLNSQELEYLQLMVSAIKHTIEIQEDLNPLFDKILENLIDFNMNYLNTLIDKKTLLDKKQLLDKFIKTKNE